MQTQGAFGRCVCVTTALKLNQWPDWESGPRPAGSDPLKLVPSLPDFSLESYAHLIGSLRDAGYRFAPIASMRSRVARPTVYLRHDVDLHLLQVDRVGQVEADLGVGATYYIALTQPYNVLNPDSAAILRRLIDQGHELGLHYDLTCYPTDSGPALDHLAWEVSVLERASGATVRSICMHQPHTGHENLFAANDTWLNPHDPRIGNDVMYVSDSCRAWRDESLLRCLGDDPPRRLMLNTHPELWLDGSIAARERYLEQVVMGNAFGLTERYLDQTVRAAWRNHSGARAHDARIATTQKQT